MSAYGTSWALNRLSRGLRNRKFEFDVERAIFLTVLHRLFASGSDKSCERWRRDYAIEEVESLQLHHLYRAMAFLGEALKDQTEVLPFSPRCIKDEIEEYIFASHRDLFSGLDLVFFDTTSIYFEGNGGQSLGRYAHSKDHRPDLKQMVVGAVIDDNGRPICCEMWPGNTADVKTLIPIADRLRERFHVGRFYLVADRGMISAETIKELESSKRKLPYILGARMKKLSSIKPDRMGRRRRSILSAQSTRPRLAAPNRLRSARSVGTGKLHQDAISAPNRRRVIARPVMWLFKSSDLCKGVSL